MQIDIKNQILSKINDTNIRNLINCCSFEVWEKKDIEERCLMAFIYSTEDVLKELSEKGFDIYICNVMKDNDIYYINFFIEDEMFSEDALYEDFDEESQKLLLDQDRQRLEQLYNNDD